MMYFKESEIQRFGYVHTGKESKLPPSSKEYVESSGHFPHTPEADSNLKWFKLESGNWKEYRLTYFNNPPKYPDHFPTQYVFKLTPQTNLEEASEIIDYWSKLSRLAHLVDFGNESLKTMKLTEDVAKAHFPKLFNSRNWWK